MKTSKATAHLLYEAQKKPGKPAPERVYTWHRLLDAIDRLNARATVHDTEPATRANLCGELGIGDARLTQVLYEARKHVTITAICGCRKANTYYERIQ